MFKTQADLIQRIHDEFDTAEERLLSQANEILKGSSTNVISVSERLKNVGFVNTPTAQKGEKLKTQVVKSTKETELINYYKFNYPFLKFLTESELDRICEKYSLIYAPVANYAKDVPMKNVNDIERVQSLKSIDIPENKIYCLLKRDGSFLLTNGNGGNWCGIWGSEWYRIPKRINDMHFRHIYQVNNYLHEQGFTTEYLVDSVTNHEEDRQGLFIAAPPSHFNLSGLSKKSKHGFFNVFKQEIKDPIVFRYVRGGIQVITKWGLEAEDEALVVDKLN